MRIPLLPPQIAVGFFRGPIRSLISAYNEVKRLAGPSNIVGMLPISNKEEKPAGSSRK